MTTPAKQSDLNNLLSSLVDLTELQHKLEQAGLAKHASAILNAVKLATGTTRHGDLGRWIQVLAKLHDMGSLSETAEIDLNGPAIRIGHNRTLSSDHRDNLETVLRELIPWRKGPFSICGIDIDTEWRSDWKWQRVLPHLPNLEGKKILDVGCGNGYHLWKMIGAGADFALGVDPVALYAVQFAALQHFIDSPSASFLPMRLEQLPEGLACFDIVFSMGVIYHHKNPQAHLDDLHGVLNPGGQLILETLVMPPGHPTLAPEERYARMRNISVIPNSATLAGWMSDRGFKDVQIVCEDWTDPDEQRTTSWMPFESLAEALQPGVDNPDPGERLTIEGHPAPRRAILIARQVP